jgi:hypothetical protein
VHVALGQALIIYMYALPYWGNKSAVVTVYLVIVRRAVPESAHTVRLINPTYRSFPAYSVNK